MMKAMMAAGVVAAFGATALSVVGPRDVPVRRSSHTWPTATAGGLAILAGWIAGWWLLPPLMGTLLLFGIAAALLGLLDDVFGLGPRVKLAGQGMLIAAAIATYGALPMPFGLGVAFSLLWGLAVINAVNFMDGADGMAAGTALVVLVTLAEAFGVSGHSLVVLAVAVAVFLPFNLGKRLFMGDCGSHLLGAVIAVTVLIAPSVFWLVVAGLLPFAVDTASTLLMRAWRRAPFWQAHRDHAYQILMRSGWSHLRVSALYTAASALGVAGLKWMPAGFGLMWLVVYGAFLWMIALHARRWAQNRAKAASGS
jgi:UDP-N-acetylmuramyl pentapeptide phosphotransferase/UDP-N-acetylglucosamine-1-phosphate transferase